MDIKLEKQGRILRGPYEGAYEGYFVKFRDDTDVTGGYYILLVDDLITPTHGGDYWVKDWAELEEFVTSSHWEFEWLEDSGDTLPLEHVPAVERGDPIAPPVRRWVVVDAEGESMSLEIDEDAARWVLSVLAADGWASALMGLSMLSCVSTRRDFVASPMKRGEVAAMCERRASLVRESGLMSLNVEPCILAIANADVPEAVTFSFTNEAWTCVVLADPGLQHPIGSMLIANEKPSPVMEPGPGSGLGRSEQ